MSRRRRAARWAAFAIGLALAGAAGPAAYAATGDEVAFAQAAALAWAGRCPEALAGLAELAAPTAQSAHLRAQCQLDELEKYITDRWSTSLRWSYLNNHSNVAVFEYDRGITGVYLTYRLKR